MVIHEREESERLRYLEFGILGLSSEQHSNQFMPKQQMKSESFSNRYIKESPEASSDCCAQKVGRSIISPPFASGF